MNSLEPLAIHKIVGTGGLGLGMIYLLDGDHPLGKSESRNATLMPFQDFCKIQIIFHYVSKLIQEHHLPIEVIPISGLGQDANGEKIFQMLTDVGMKSDYIKISPHKPTISCLCLNYPDGSSSNIAEKDSACNELAIHLFPEIDSLFDANTVFVAAPEVPLDFRLSLLQKAKAKGAKTLASFSSGELKLLKETDFQTIDILLANYDETISLLQLPLDASLEKILEQIPKKLSFFLKERFFIFTNGKKDVYFFHKNEIRSLKPFATNSPNTAGAGDAFMSGVLYGLVKGCPIYSDLQPCAMKWGLFFARISVESKDTIAFDFNSARLKKLISDLNEKTYEV